MRTQKEIDDYGRVLKVRSGIISRIRDFLYVKSLPIATIQKTLKRREDIKVERLAKKHPLIYKSKAIVIEGIDGMGKATLTERIYKRQRDENKDPVIIDYPNYKSWSSFLVKLYLRGTFSKDPNKIPPKLASLFYAFDRWVDYHKRVKAYRYAGRFIIYDRYISSNHYFQGAKILNMPGQSKTLREKTFKEYYKWSICFEHIILGIPYVEKVHVLTMTENQYRELVLSNSFKNKHNGKNDIHEKREFLLNTLECTGLIIKTCGWTQVPVATTEKGRYSFNTIHRRTPVAMIAWEIKLPK